MESCHLQSSKLSLESPLAGPETTICSLLPPAGCSRAKLFSEIPWKLSKGTFGRCPCNLLHPLLLHPPRPGQPRPPWRHKEANARTKGLDGEAACCGAQSQLSPSLHSTSPALVSRSMRCCGFWKVVMFSHVLPLDDSNKKIMCPCSFSPPHTHTRIHPKEARK